jgi:hypothetical protein
MEGEPRNNLTGLAAGIIGVVVLLAVLAVLFDLGPFADDPPSAAEFLAQGDELCKKAHEEFLEIQGSAPRTAADAEEQVEALIDVAEEERDAIADLDPPASLDDDVSAYLKDRDEGIEVLQEGLEAARDDDPHAYEEAQARLASQQAKRQAAARGVGFSECSAPLVDRDELERQAQPPESG